MFGLITLLCIIYFINSLIDNVTHNTPRDYVRRIESAISCQNEGIRMALQDSCPFRFIKIENNVFYAQLSQDHSRVVRIIERIPMESVTEADKLSVYDWKDIGA